MIYLNTFISDEETEAERAGVPSVSEVSAQRQVFSSLSEVFNIGLHRFVPLQIPYSDHSIHCTVLILLEK